MMDRISGKAQADKTPIGFIPRIADLDLTGLAISKETMEGLFEIKSDEWKQEIQGIEAFYAQFGGRIPKELTDHLTTLKNSL